MIRKLMIMIFQTYCRTVLTTYAPVTIYGKENLPKRPFILYSNHTSHLDYIILSIFSDLGFRKTCVMAAKDYWFENKFRNWFSNVFFNGIPVNRNQLFNAGALDEIVENCNHKIKSDKTERSLIIFPEGKRSINGKIQKFKIGPAAIARDLDIPIVPAFIDGTYSVWPKGKNFMKPGRISLHFGEEFRLEADKEKSIETYKSDTAVLEKHLHQLSKNSDLSL